MQYDPLAGAPLSGEYASEKEIQASVLKAKKENSLQSEDNEPRKRGRPKKNQELSAQSSSEPVKVEAPPIEDPIPDDRGFVYYPIDAISAEESRDQLSFFREQLLAGTYGVHDQRSSVSDSSDPFAPNPTKTLLDAERARQIANERALFIKSVHGAAHVGKYGLGSFIGASKRESTIDKFEKREKKHRERKADWNDPADKAEYLKQKRLEDRLTKIKTLFPDGLCPVCQRKIYNPASWIIKSNVHCCRSCYMSGAWNQAVRVSDPNYETVQVEDPFGEPERLPVNASLLAHLREEMGVSVQNFVNILGKSMMWWYSIMDGRIKNVTVAEADLIRSEAAKRGIQLTKSKFDEEKK